MTIRRQVAYGSPETSCCAAAEDRAVSEAQRSAAELRSAQFAVATARFEVEAARTTLKYAGSASSSEVVPVPCPGGRARAQDPAQERRHGGQRPVADRDR
jgi:hypothetical protein